MGKALCLVKPYIVLFHIHGTSIPINSLLFVKKTLKHNECTAVFFFNPLFYGYGG